MANVQITYGASSTLACTLASLASDSNLVAGRESAAFDNSAAQNTDVLLAGKITTGSAPTGGEIRIYVAGSYNDTPLWPDSLAGANAARTMTSYPIRDAALKFAAAGLQRSRLCEALSTVLALLTEIRAVTPGWKLWKSAPVTVATSVLQGASRALCPLLAELPSRPPE